MNIGATLIGQMITFFLLVWFTMKFVWPPLMKAMEERRRRIADGLAAGEKGKRDLEQAQRQVQEALNKAKAQAGEILAQAERRSMEIVEEAKAQAKTEAERIVQGAQVELEREVNRAREQLRHTVADLAVAGASRILEKEVDKKTHARLLDDLVKQL